MTQDKFVQARRKKEVYRGMSTDDNADCADLDKSNAQVINGQFLRFIEMKEIVIYILGEISV